MEKKKPLPPKNLSLFPRILERVQEALQAGGNQLGQESLVIWKRKGAGHPRSVKGHVGWGFEHFQV